METVELQVEPRQSKGKGAAREMRRNGKVPGILYGAKRDSIAVIVDEKDFEKKVGLEGRAQIIKLQSGSPDLSGMLVLVKDTQRHPLSRNLIHADLYEVDVEAKIRVSVQLHPVGKAAGVELGGILQPIRREVEVLCLPMEIPVGIDVDVTDLGIHDTLHVSDLRVPAGVEIPYDTDFAIVTVLPPVVEEVKAEEAEGEEAAGEEGAAPMGEAAEGDKPADAKESKEGE
jgi:large subunit ribosomal protein L25